MDVSIGPELRSEKTARLESERKKKREFKKQFRQVNRVIFSVIFMVIGAGIYHSYHIRSWDGLVTLVVIGLWFMKIEWSSR